MNKNTYLVLGAVVLIVAALAAGRGVLLPTGSPAAAVVGANQPIRMGFIGPLSGDGASWGEIEKNAIELTVDDINSSGGINGRPIEITYEDGKCDGATALSAAEKLVEVDKIKILLVSCSQEMLPIAPYANAHKVVALTSYASASGITDAGPYIFRNSYTNGEMAAAMARQALKYGSRVAIISEESAFATDLRDLFIVDITKAGGTIVDNENYPQGARDLATQATKIVAAKPDVIVANPNSTNTGLVILQNIRGLGYQGQFIGNFFGGSTTIQESKYAQGMVYVSDPVFAESPLKQKVFDEYKARFGSYPDLPWPVGARYDALYILKDAFLAVGDDSTAVMGYLHHMPSDFTGILGTYRFHENDADITNIAPTVAKIEHSTSIEVQ